MSTSEMPHELVREFLRECYGMIAWMLWREKWTVKEKRIYRIWKHEVLRVSSKKKRRKAGSAVLRVESAVGAERVNHVWSTEFTSDRTINGYALKIALIA